MTNYLNDKNKKTIIESAELKVHEKGLTNKDRDYLDRVGRKINEKSLSQLGMGETIWNLNEDNYD